MFFQEWGWLRIENNQELRNKNVKESLNAIYTHSLKGLYVVSILLMFYPRNVLYNIFLVETNKNIQKEKLEVASFGEFLQWINILIFSNVSSLKHPNFCIIDPI